jgi:hypothetical protein
MVVIDQFRVPAALPPRKGPSLLIGGHQSLSGRFGVKRILFPFRKSKRSSSDVGP